MPSSLPQRNAKPAILKHYAVQYNIHYQTVLKTKLFRFYLLATALNNIGLVKLTKQARCLTTSQSNFISSNLYNILNLSKHNDSVSIIGINQKITQINHMVIATIKSTTNNYNFTSSFLILDNITNNLPTTTIHKRYKDTQNIMLADPIFYVSNKIDLLIAVSVFYGLLCRTNKISQSGYSHTSRLLGEKRYV